MNAKWLNVVFEDAQLRASVHDLARYGTHDQLLAMLEAADKAKNKDYVNEDYRTVCSNQK